LPDYRLEVFVSKPDAPVQEPVGEDAVQHRERRLCGSFVVTGTRLL
jgi:hypothetical protein